MALPGVTWLFNTTAYDGAHTRTGSAGTGADNSYWFVFDPGEDKFIFTSDEQNNGDPTTGTIYPVPIPESGSLEAPKTFVWDNSATTLRQVPLAGTSNGMQNGGDNQYVFCLYFSGSTESIPYLEAWDSLTHTTADCAFLNHSGVSLLSAVATTNGSPGNSVWAGTALRGADSRILLDTAAVPGGGKPLYFNLRLSIPSTFTAQTYTAARLFTRFLYS